MIPTTKKVLYFVCIGVLFFVLSPGVLLTLPPETDDDKCGVLIQSSKDTKGCATSYGSAAVHTVVFLLVAIPLGVWLLNNNMTPRPTNQLNFRFY